MDVTVAGAPVVLLLGLPHDLVYGRGRVGYPSGQTRTIHAACPHVVHAVLTMNEPTELTVVVDLDELFRLHYGRLVRTLTVVAGDRERAADAVQEAFVKAHLKWRRVQQYDDPVGWIRRVAINRLRDGHRSESRRARTLDRLGVASHTTGSGPDLADGLGGGGAEVLGLLGTLPRQQRLCLALFYVDELSIAEIAAALDISEGAVKFHLHQGRERLRDRHTTDPEQKGRRS
jgi:RNA polymerase sigma-70 factor (ECF subfamily)